MVLSSTPATPPIAIATEDLIGGYGVKTVLRSVSLRVPQGTVFGLLGPNGSGKSTLLRMMLGLLVPVSGTVTLFGRRIGKIVPFQILRQIGALIEDPSLYGHLSGKENLRIAGILKGIDTDRVETAVRRLALDGREDKPVSTYSRGMRQWTGVVMATMGSPDLVVLDEPINGLDSERIDSFLKLVKHLNEVHRTTFVITTHRISVLEEVIAHVGMLGLSGDLLYMGDRDRLAASVPRELAVRARDPHKAMSLLKEYGYHATREGAYLSLSGASEETAETVSRLLIEAGIGITHLVLSATDLESVFARTLREVKPWKPLS